MTSEQIIRKVLRSNAFHDEGEENGIRWFITGVESDAPHVLYGITSEAVLFSDDDGAEASECESQSFNAFCKEAF